MNTKLNQLLTMGLLALLSLACTPDGAEYVDELDIVYTNHDPNFNFTSKGTFAIPDEVIKIDVEDVPGEPGFVPDFVDPVYANAILETIKSNMRNYGYTEVDESANPDLIILPSAMQTDQLYFYYDWWYWNWYYPGWGPGWGWYYPGYFPPQVSRIRTGSVFIQMTDPSNQSATDKIPVVWTSVVNGLFEGNINSISSRITQTIDQAFEQSPYLAK
ncbi:DUF4136 domain-containing protein [Algoriphagus namhaensis]